MFKGLFQKEKSFFYMAPALVWQILFFVVPLLFVFQLAFFSQFLQGLTWQYFSQVFYFSHFSVIFRSLRLASSTAFLCLFFGYPVAYFLALCVSPRFKQLLLFLVTLPFLTNLLVQIYAWYFILEKNGLLNQVLSVFTSNTDNWLNSSLAMYLVMFHIYLPFMIMPLYTILEKMNVRLIEASLDLGASYTKTFFRIVFPLSLEGIKTGFFLVYVTTFGEYVVPALLGGQKQYYVGTLISEYFFIGRDWHVGAAFTCLSIFIFGISIYLYSKLLHRLTLWMQKV